jgi:hypothetical protein
LCTKKKRKREQRAKQQFGQWEMSKIAHKQLVPFQAADFSEDHLLTFGTTVERPA